MKIQQADATWRNWSGSHYSSPQIFELKEINELQTLVKSHTKIRVVGAGHSFSALAKTDEVLIRLDHFKGVIDVNEAKA